MGDYDRASLQISSSSYEHLKTKKVNMGDNMGAITQSLIYQGDTNEP